MSSLIKTPFSSPFVKGGNRGFIILLSLVFVVIFGLYSINLTNNLFYDDEGIYLYSAKLISQGQKPYRDFFLCQMPFGFLLLGGAFKLFGTTFTVARIFSVISILLSIIFGSLILDKIIDNKKLPVAFAALTSAIILYPARWWAPSVIMTTFLTIGIFCFVMHILKESKFYLFLAGLFLGLATITRLYGGIIFCLAASVFLAFNSETKNKIQKLALLNFSFLLPCLLVIFYIYPNFGQFSEQAISYTVFTRLKNPLMKMTISDMLWVLLTFLENYGILFILAVAGTVKLLKEKKEIGKFFVVFLTTVVIVWVVLRFTFEHTLSYSHPVLVGLALYFLIDNEKFYRKDIYYLVTLLLFLNYLLNITWQDWHLLRDSDRTPLKIAEYLQQKTKPDEYVLSDYPLFNFFSDRKAPPELTDVSNSRTTGRWLLANDIIKNIEKFSVSIVIIHPKEYGGHHLVNLCDYLELEKYLSKNFILRKFAYGKGEILVYERNRT